MIQPAVIPNQFIFVYGLHPDNEPLHLIHYLCMRSCIQINQPDRVMLCSPEEPEGHYWELLRSEVEWVRVDPVPLVDKMAYADSGINPYRYAHHSDFIRLEQLLAQGGVYADLDTLFINPLPAELFNKPFVLGRERDIADPHTGEAMHSLCNAVIMSVPNGAFCRRWYDAMAEAFDGTWSNHSTLLPQHLAQQYPDEIHIEAECSFYHFPPTAKGISQLFDGRVSLPEDAYSMHLWAHLWWSDLRVDFSAFDASRITEEYVRTMDTTYTLAARPFLPARSSFALLHKIGTKLATGIHTARHRIARRFQEVRYGLKLLRQQGSDATHARALIQRQLIFHSACRILDITDGSEEAILENVILADEYGLITRQFDTEDVIIDVGAHLGAFSRLCYELGSRNVYAYETDPVNFQRLQQHIGDLDGIHLAELALFRSDIDSDHHSLVYSGPAGVNSGGGNVIFRGLLFSFLNQQAWSLPGQATSVETLALDEVLRKFDRVTLLKLDCEGSEFPILLTSQELHRVDEIVGEFHEVSSELMSELDPAARVGKLRSYNAGLLAVKLKAAGFNVSITKMAKHMGYFHAIRETN